jgi:glutathione peroxidase-family protein
MATLYDFQMESISGEAVKLSDYEGKVCLVVNVASK